MLGAGRVEADGSRGGGFSADGITPIELFSVGDLFFLNNAEGTMGERNSGSLMVHIAQLMRHMKIGSRMITVDQVSELTTNCWEKQDWDPEDRGCWMKEERVRLFGAYSWNRGHPKEHHLWLYTKVRNSWICNSCTVQNDMSVKECECQLDPNHKPAEKRRSRRAAATSKRQRTE